MPNILDSKFKYVESSKTDLKKTFARVRKELAEQAKRESDISAEQAVVVRPIKRTV